MPVKSYLAHPQEGKKTDLVKALSLISNCDIFPAENENLLIIVTETETKEEEENLEKKIESIESLKLLAMVSGFNTK